MWFYIILALIAAVAIGFIIWRSNFGDNQSSQGSARAPAPMAIGSDEPRIENMQPGGLFSLRGFGADLDDIDVQVLAKHGYDEDGYRWFELEGDAGGRKVWLTVETDDETELSITLEKLKLGDLNLTQADLQRFVDDDEGEFLFRGRRYVYEDWGEAMFHRDCDELSGERFRYWEFESDDGDSAITIERWSDGETECHLSQPLRESQLTVYTISGTA